MRFRAFAAASGLVFSAFCAGCFVYGEDLLATGSNGGGGAGAGSTTSNPTTGTTTTGMPCSAPEDCPDTGSLCQKPACVDQVCVSENLAPNTEVADPTPGNCRSIICDSAGGTIEVENSKDVPSDGKFCTVDSCDLGKPKHVVKLGFACNEDGGKHCNDNGDCVECASDANCASKVCKDYACASAECSDTIMNGTETAVDCGGGVCQDCDSGKTCTKASDCKSGICTGLICQPSCTDGATNLSETDIDCGGGACPVCDDLKSCGVPADCKSGVCTAETCAAPACDDGKKNGDEDGIDCGGLACSSCTLDHIVINEIDYDQPNTDSAEFVEIYNATSGPVSLANYKLILVDGVANVAYGAVNLAPAGTLAAGQYLVIGPAGLTIAAGAAKIDFPSPTNQLQNGLSGGMGSPDGLALIDDAANTLIDVVSYEGAITTADLATWGLGTVSLVEGAALNAAVKDEGAGSLCRLPNSKDTNESGADWGFTATATPGAPNSAN